MKHSTPLLFFAGFATMLAAGWTGLPAVLYKSTSQPVQFNHKIHKDKAGMQCQDCHALRQDGSFAGIPGIDNCTGCHSEAQGTSAAEKTVVAEYVKPARQIAWKVYSRQPDNVRFSHAIHVTRGKLKCEQCHGEHGSSTALPVYEENRISGYSRNIWGHNLARVGLKGGDGMKMTDCEGCHQERGVQAGCLGCHR